MSLETKLENPWHSSWPLTAGYDKINCTSNCMSKTNHLLVIGLKDSYNSNFATFFYDYTFFCTNNAKNISLAWLRTRLREKKPRKSNRSACFARRFLPFFPNTEPGPGLRCHTFCFGIARRHKTYDVKISYPLQPTFTKIRKVYLSNR